MVSFSSLLLTVSAVVSVVARPAEVQVKRSITTSQTGTSDGYYYSFYTDGGGNVTYNNDGPGAYDVTWVDSGDFVAGVGWANGSARHIHYNASYLPDGNSYLSVYGWTTSPLIEYYITEALGTYNPGPSMTFRGTVYSDGSLYDIYNNTRTDEPSIIGTATFQQFWSIRRDERTAGTVRTGRHFERWRELGLVLGESFGYQILATEGYDSSGFSSVTVS